MRKIKQYIYSLIVFLLFSSMIHAVDGIKESRLYINHQAPSILSKNDQKDLKKLVTRLSVNLKGPNNDQDVIEFYHIFQQYDNDHSILSLEDGSQWDIAWYYNSIPKKWTPGDRLKIAYHSIYANYAEFINVDTSDSETAWGVLKKGPDEWEWIARIPNSPNDPDAWKKVILHSGWVFLNQSYISDWNIKDKVFIFHNGPKYDLWNLSKGEITTNFDLVGNEKQYNFKELEFPDILNLEEKLNSQVLGQNEASNAVTSSMLNYVAGLKDPGKPIAAFLFIGPTGVGKTELAKVLTKELYHSNDHLIRFDMSHFTEPHSVARLIGSPPGYVNHEEGGQLTESLKKYPQSVVLLDEMEKANSTVHKFFLPILDEGYVVDTKNHEINCKQTIFILTSNLCSEQIAKLFKMNYSQEDVLSGIEPDLIKALSPELYNRLEPVLFRPLGKEIMEELVEVQLNLLTERIQRVKNMTLILDNSVKEYLIENGFHPNLGARPLKNLIEKKMVANLAKAIISDRIPEGSQITMSYLFMEDSWFIDWVL